MSTKDAAPGDALSLRARPSIVEPVVATSPGTPGVYVLRKAYAAIKEHIGWGRRTARNVVEQAGLLIGHRYRDPASGEPFAVVERVLDAQFGESNSGAITLTHDTWFDLLNRLDALAVPKGQTAWQIIGWYHTHPNGLPVFMSGTDRRTQRDFFAGPEYFAFVLNPHKFLWAAFQGADCDECCAVAFEEAGSAPVEDDRGKRLLEQALKQQQASRRPDRARAQAAPLHVAPPPEPEPVPETRATELVLDAPAPRPAESETEEPKLSGEPERLQKKSRGCWSRLGTLFDKRV